MTTCLPLSTRHGADAHAGSPACAPGTTARAHAQTRTSANSRISHGKTGGPPAVKRVSAHAGANAQAQLGRLARRVGHARDEDEPRVLLQPLGERPAWLEALPAQRDGLLLRGDGERAAANAALAALHAQAALARLAHALRQREPHALQLRRRAEAGRERPALLAEAQRQLALGLARAGVHGDRLAAGRLELAGDAARLARVREQLALEREVGVRAAEIGQVHDLSGVLAAAAVERQLEPGERQVGYAVERVGERPWQQLHRSDQGQRYGRPENHG